MILFVASAFPAGAQSSFVPGFDDLPLMAGLAAASDAVVFDAPGGRIIDVQLAGATSPARVIEFYRDTLPQLGWKMKGSSSAFERDGELLTLVIDEPERGKVTVRVSLTPAGK